MAKLQITWSKSWIGFPETQRKTIKSMGFHKLNNTIVREDSPQLRGQIRKVQHLLTVVELAD